MLIFQFLASCRIFWVIPVDKVTKRGGQTHPQTIRKNQVSSDFVNHIKIVCHTKSCYVYHLSDCKSYPKSFQLEENRRPNPIGKQIGSVNEVRQLYIFGKSSTVSVNQIGSVAHANVNCRPNRSETPHGWSPAGHFQFIEKISGFFSHQYSTRFTHDNWEHDKSNCYRIHGHHIEFTETVEQITVELAGVD